MQILLIRAGLPVPTSPGPVAIILQPLSQFQDREIEPLNSGVCFTTGLDYDLSFADPHFSYVGWGRLPTPGCISLWFGAVMFKGGLLVGKVMTVL